MADYITELLSNGKSQNNLYEGVCSCKEKGTKANFLISTLLLFSKHCICRILEGSLWILKTECFKL